jgi:uncharacterized protein YndB with AHSA1/START domain
MSRKSKTATSAPAPRAKLTFERTFPVATLNEVWELWTTKAGLESWWGPEGVVTAVRKLELRPGGKFEYAMTATDPAQIEGLKAAGLPRTTVAAGTYTEVTPRTRLVYQTLADFIPGVAPYEVVAVVEIHARGHGVHMVVTEDAMHDEQWTKLSAMGMNSSLDKLVKVLEARHRRG